MPEIVLTTLNAKYIHAAFGLRYLMANLGELQPQAALLEFDINQRPLDIVEVLLAQKPRILGFGVYIWNVTETTEVVAALKRVQPEIIVVLGGPEVSYETETQTIVALADHVITGEADLKFAEICRALLGGRRVGEKILAAPLPAFDQLVLPYEFYNNDDVAHRVIYVEASRGCPFSCEFCLSSLDIPVRQAPLDRLLESFQRLLDRGVRQFKFVDRTFNLNLSVGQTLLQFFEERYQPGLFLHFEMIPDRLPAPLRDPIARFPAGSLQFEVGIQSFNEDVCRRIHRRQDVAKMEENFKFLRAQTGVHIHADLIVGLPGESVESFAAGFDRLAHLRPQEIQVGILKRLRGTSIVRHDVEWGMRYSSHPPYEVLQTSSLDFSTLQRLRRFAKYWDLVMNSGHFLEAAPLLWTHAEEGKSPFGEFLRFSDWLFQRVGRTDSIALLRLCEGLWTYLVGELQIGPARVADALWRDWQRAGRRERPEFLKAWWPDEAQDPQGSPKRTRAKRQARHLMTAAPLGAESIASTD